MNGEPRFEPTTLLAAKAVESAACTLLQMIQDKSKIEVTIKADKTLLLNVDLALQKAILTVLRSTPLKVVSEELPDTHQWIGSTEDYFLVDPLDGTTSCKRFFAHQYTQVGFGPMVGVVKAGTLNAVAFFNAPSRKLFIAEKNKGAWVKTVDAYDGAKLVYQGSNVRLSPVVPSALNECSMLFYAGLNGELAAIEKIKRKDLIENMYRFGGFANDCSRIAEGYEQVQLQFTVKAWDIPASLLIAESGVHDVLVKSEAGWTPVYERVLAMENPMCACPKAFAKVLIGAISETSGSFLLQT